MRRFHEKPELANAKRYLAAGNFYWNSGMFFWRADVLLDQLRRHLPRTASRAGFPAPLRIAPLRRRPEAGLSALREHLDRLRRDREGRPATVSGIAAGDFGWNDVGSWNAVYELLPRDACGNVVAPDSICLDAHDNFVDARGKVVALLGVRDLIVVDTPDALLVAARDRAQRVGEVVKALEKRERHDFLLSGATPAWEPRWT